MMGFSDPLIAFQATRRRRGETCQSSNEELSFLPQPPSPEDRRIRFMENRERAIHGTAADRCHFLLQDVFIVTPDFGFATSAISDRIQHAGMGVTVSGMRVIAPGGAGKDAIVRFIQQRHPAWGGGTLFVKPILAVTLRERLAPSQMLLTFHSQLQSASKASQGLESLEDTLFTAMQDRKTQAIIINEAHHILRIKPSKRLEPRLAGVAGDWLKGFIDRCPKPIILLGVPGWDELFDHDPQLGTRVRGRVDLGPLSEKDFLGVLQALDEVIPIWEPAGLIQPEIAEPLYRIAQGNWRMLINFLRDALLSATNAGARKIELADLSYAYWLTFGPKDQPFGPRRQP